MLTVSTQNSSSPATMPHSVGASQLEVDAESDGQRLDNFLIRHLKGVPKTHLYRIIRSGEVRVNKGRAKADTRVQAGQQVRLPPIRLSESATAKAANPAPARGFDVLHEDERLIAINKPPGVAVHGGSGLSFGVIEQLRAARPEAKFLELVHRLDRETSGVLLVAKKRSALNAVQAQFRNRAVQKTYLAVVHGTWPAKLKLIDKALHKYLTADGERRVRLAVAGDADDDETATEGKRAITLVTVLRTAKAQAFGANWAAALGSDACCSLLQVRIKTGRTHQIRVHLASHGHPIVGDEKYGLFSQNKALAKQGLPRMYLHAWQLVLAADGEQPELALEAQNPFGLPF